MESRGILMDHTQGLELRYEDARIHDAQAQFYRHRNSL